MDQNNTDKYIKEIRKTLWYERLIYFPTKLIIAYFIYAYFEDGIFIIFGYLLFCVGNQSMRQFINSQELNATIKQTHESLSEFSLKHHTDLMKRIEKIEDQALEITELDIRLSDLEQP